MLLTVLSVAFPFAPVSPDAVGGAEQILSSLDRGLIAAGHRSLVVACEGSRPAGELFSFPLAQTEALTPADQLGCRSEVQAAIDRALAAHPVDVIHTHGLDLDAYQLPADIPVLITLHLPIAWYSPEVWRKYAARAHFCCVSESQRLSLPAEVRNCTVIENGVPMTAVDPFQPKDDFALVLGRVCPEKNAHAAFEAGTLAGTRVLLGGEVFPYPEHLRYFRNSIAPLLAPREGRPQHEFLGRLPHERKQQLLGSAKCLLHPTLAPETSSLVAMEALAAGTPVIAYRSGALPEIIDHGLTGFLVDNVQEMAQALRQVHTISPVACRQAAARRFSLQRMIRRYFDLYGAIPNREQTEALYA